MIACEKGTLNRPSTEYRCTLGCVNFLDFFIFKKSSSQFKEFWKTKKTHPFVLKSEVGDLHEFGPEGGNMKIYKHIYNFFPVHLREKVSTLLQNKLFICFQFLFSVFNFLAKKKWKLCVFRFLVFYLKNLKSQKSQIHSKINFFFITGGGEPNVETKLKL